MKRLFIFSSLLLFTIVLHAQFMVPVFNEPIKLKSLSNEAEETKPLPFNNGTEFLFHRIYLDESGDEIEVKGKDIWYSKVDEGATKKIEDTAFYKKKWQRPYRLFRDGEVKGLNAVFGISNDGQTIYMINTTFTKDTFNQKLVSLARKGKNSWEKEYNDIEIPGLILDGRSVDLTIHEDEDVILVSMAPTHNSLNEDLYVSFKKANGKWSTLKSLGESINTNRFEISPFLSKDKKRLYFTSNGYDGFGGGDIYMSTRLDDSWEKWTRPINLGEPINSKDFDAYFTISEKDDIYFVSDRSSDYYDIFYTKSTGKYTIPNVDSVAGEFLFKQLAVAETELEVYDANGNLIQLIVTDEEGKFNFIKLASDEDYVLKLVSEDNTELVGGMLYFLDENGAKKKRFILADDGVFKSANKMPSKELVQGVYTLNKEPQAASVILFKDVNDFVVDSIITDEKGHFTYKRLSNDSVFTMKPNDLNNEDIALADLYLTNENGERIRTFDLSGGFAGKGKLFLKNLPLANSVLKVFDADGNLVETIVTKADGSFAYKKLSLDEEMVMKLAAEDADLVGGIVYFVDASNNKKRFFIQEGNSLVHPEAFGKETVYGMFNYKKLPMSNAALEVLDQNGMPIDTIYTDENGLFSYEKMNLDKSYTLRPLGLSEQDLVDQEIFLTDKKGNKTGASTNTKNGGFVFVVVDESKVVALDNKPKKSSVQENDEVLYFDYNVVSLSASAKRKMDSFIKQLNSNDKKIVLIGHTDDTGSDEVNQRVGMKRAESAKQYLLNRGVSSNRIQVLSKGESSPVANNKTPSGRAKNRRVEVKLN